MKLDRYTVGKRYGKALFTLALEKDQVDSIFQDLLKLREIFEEILDLGEVLSDVRLQEHEKQTIVAELEKGFCGYVRNFIQVVFENRRMDDIPLMIDEYERRYNEHSKIIVGKIITAVPISADQTKSIETAFAKKVGYLFAKLENVVDPSIIGGVITEADHLVIDGSIQTQLQKIQKLLLK